MNHMKRQRGYLALPVAVSFIVIFGLLFDNWWLGLGIGIAMFFAFQGTKKKA
ncbi:putative membrane protein [Exiguobacterium sp. S17]|nr:putative membrane protein [Exiguobacterium sp. S17]